MKGIKNQNPMDQVFGNPKFRGKHVIIIGRKIFVAATGEQAKKTLDKVHKKYPNKIPAITYIPKADTLILSIGEKYQGAKRS